MSQESLQFWKDYLLQTRKEIDLEKTEGTRILHLKILLIGALFLLVKGPAGLAAFALLPLVMVALDQMQLSRLHYILHRWEYLDNVVVPRLRAALGDQNATFFEEAVVKRHKEGFYLPLEASIRTFLFIPALAASAATAALLARKLSAGSLPCAYLVGLGWLAALAVIALRDGHVYRRLPTVVVATLVAIGLVLDWTVGNGFMVARLEQMF